MVTVVRESRRREVEEALLGAGATIMPFRIDREGLAAREL
jgi:hypothetical protein